jgi:hypothetical protein
MYKKIISLIIVLIFLYLLFYFIPIYKGNSKAIFNNYQKLWVHRVLDSNDANTKYVNFKGIEVDVFFEIEKNVFDVRHHGKYRGNTLLDFLSNINDKELFFWIDLKNLNNKNVLAIRNRLTEIIVSGVNKEHILIESKNIELLEVLQNEGFYVSYWLPTFNFIKSTYEVFQVKNDLIKYKPNAISCSYYNVDFYSRKFPKYNLHCWTNGLEEGRDNLKVFKISLRDNVKVILVDFENNFIQ